MAAIPKNLSLLMNVIEIFSIINLYICEVQNGTEYVASVLGREV